MNLLLATFVAAVLLGVAATVASRGYRRLAVACWICSAAPFFAAAEPLKATIAWLGVASLAIMVAVIWLGLARNQRRSEYS